MKHLILKSFLVTLLVLGSIFTIISCTNANNDKNTQVAITNHNHVIETDIKENLVEEVIAEVVIEKATELTDLDFYNTINKGVTLVDFWAAWCAPCRIQGPIVDDVAKEMGVKANVTKLNVDHYNAISMSYDVKSIPTIIIFKDGKPLERFVGVQSKEFLLQKLNAHI